MHTVSTFIPAHTHTLKNGTHINLPPSPHLCVPHNRLNPNTSEARVEKILSLIPVVGLFMAGYLFYQKQSVMKEAYKQLDYSPNEKCANLTCSNLDPSHLNLAIAVSIFGGLGLLFPIMGVFALIFLIISQVSKMIASCQHSYSNSTLPT
ncbi:hypothetical protein [Chlamydia abortus]|uniref:hypothetical protein n=1 Tax=Chlamydia abortus TaxID=83555 RepID=UPI001115DFBE|nr:hypothetical protein [Chlamydia abortus]